MRNSENTLILKLVFCGLIVLSSPLFLQAQNTYIVTSELDLADINPGDGTCEDVNGNCTLRAAIEEANASALKDIIQFNITGTGPHRITLTSALPAITSSINVDARTQSDYVFFAPQVMVDGSAVAGISGLVLEAGSSQSEIRGLSIGGFVHGIIIRSDENIIQECFIGVEADGVTAYANTQSGIWVEAARLNLIGGNLSTNRNLISGNSNTNAYGIRFTNATENTISGNYIGLAADGLAALRNFRGIGLLEASDDNIIGGEFGVETNYISGQSSGVGCAGCYGIYVEGTSARSIMRGNVVGLNIAQEPQRNGSGIYIAGSGGEHIIGDSDFNFRNVVSGNNLTTTGGIRIGTTNNQIIGNLVGLNFDGTLARGNAVGIILSTTSGTNNIISDNVVSSNSTGIQLFAGTNNNTFIRNKIGTDITGMIGFPSQTGISIPSSGNIIGTELADGNLFAGGGIFSGLAISGTDNIIRGNVFGLNSDYTASISNSNGINFTGGGNNEVGGILPEHKNVFAGNGTGVNIGSSSNNVVHGNYFGLTPDGVTSIGNGTGLDIGGNAMNTIIGGVFGEGTNYFAGNSTAIDMFTTGNGTIIQGNIIGLNINNEIRPHTGTRTIWYRTNAEVLIGGPNPEDRNIFSGSNDFSANQGLLLISASAPRLTLIGNYFGTTPDGLEARPNLRTAIYTLTSDGTNTIISNNLISGSTEGIRLWNGTTNYRITGNKIGTNLTGDAAIPNGIGIRLNQGSTQNNIIGGHGADANIISGNTLDGIRFTDGANNNQVIGNYIGTAADGITPLPNEAYGIEFQFRTVDNTIGGNNPQDGNIIANNLLGGVRMTWTVFTAPARNRITQNLIYDNGGLGIMLGATGPNLNDPVDADEGINRRQNYPIISETFNMDIANDLLELEYYVPSDPAFSTYPIRVEFFADDGNRQGRQIIYVDEFTEADYLLLRPKQLSIDISGLGLVVSDLPVATATDAEGNTSEFGFIVPDPPTVADEEACSGFTATFTASGASGTGVYRWYNTLASVAPTFTGNPFTTPVLSATTIYYVAIFDNSHESVRVPVEVVVFDSPIITVAPLTHQSSCVEPNGIIALEFQFVPDGIYTISYDGGTFTGVEVTAGEATIIADIGVYNDLQITVDACTSLLGINAEILDEIIIPVITVTNVNNQTSCLTVNSSIELSFTNVPDGLYIITFDGGNFIDVEILSNTAIIPAAVGVYNDLQITVGVCNSVVGVNAEILDQILIPEITVVSVSAQTSCAVDNGEIRLSFVNVPDGAYTISFDGGTFDDVVVTSGEAIIMANIGVFNDLQITVGDCTSDLGVDAEILNAIVIPEMELTSVMGQTSCLVNNGAINLSFNNVPDGVYSIVYQDGIFDDVQITSGIASIIAGPGNYFNLFITLGDCQSISAVSAVIDDLISIPTLTVSNTTPQTSCQNPDGSITLSFTNVPDGFYDISFDGGSFNNIEVSAGVSTFIATASTYNDLQITVGDCTSALGINALVEDQVGIPSITVVEINPQTSCSTSNGSILLSFTNVPDGSYTVAYDGGNFTNVLVSASEAILIVEALSFENIRITIGDCTSATGVNASIDEALNLPIITLNNTNPQTNCLVPNGSIELDISIVPDGMYTIIYDVGDFLNVEVLAGLATIITEAGNYNNLQITFGSCTSAGGINAEVTSNIQPLDSPVVQNGERCGIGTVTLSASGAQVGQEYAWYADLSEAPVEQNNTGIFNTPVLSTSTLYYVRIMDPSGCTSSAVEVLASVNTLAAPVIISTDGFVLCAGASKILEGPTGFLTYLWSTGETTKDITVSTADSYNLIVFDSNGCASEPTTIEIVTSTFPDISFTISGGLLQTVQGLIYQWYYFDEIIPGATQHFLDIDLLKYGIYRVEITNQEGCTFLSDAFEYLITSVEENQNTGLIIYPNPIQDRVRMHVQNDDSIKLWSIFDGSGKLIFNQEAVEVNNSDVSHWPNGLYFVYVKTKGKMIIRKLIKQ